MSEIKPAGYLITEHATGAIHYIKHPVCPKDMSEFELTSQTIYTKQQLDKAIEERDILIRDLRKELNERRYGRSANQ